MENERDQFEELLKEESFQQESIPDNNFSVQVMSKVPLRQNNKRRSAILIISSLVGSLLTFFFLNSTNSNQLIFKNMFQVLAHFQITGLAMIAGVLILYAAIFFTSSDDLH